MIKASLLLLLAAAMPITAFAERALDTKKAEKLAVRDSMMGYRSTLLFYTFTDQQAILTVLIDNKDETFPVTATVHLFNEKTSKEALDKWVNNQHSDGLFVGAPEPESSLELPKDAVKVTAKKKTGESDGHQGGTFNDYEVTFTIKDHTAESKFKLTGFTDTAKVHVKKP